MEKKCSKCGEKFACQQEKEGCWCEQLTLSTEILHYLKDHFENCLCPSCLREFSKKETGLGNENHN